MYYLFVILDRIVIINQLDYEWLLFLAKSEF